jgi:hypothetical protein
MATPGIATSSPKARRSTTSPAPITIRPASLVDIPVLQTMLRDQADSFEHQDLTRTIAFVAECDGRIVGFIAARCQWQIEPLLLDRLFKQEASRHAQRKATYMLIREVDRFLADRTKNRSGIYYYFCHIVDETMQKLALSFGMTRIYFGKFYGREL